MRVLDFDNDFSPDELAKALLNAGFNRATSIGQIASGKWDDDVDCTIPLDCSIDEDDAIDKLSDEAILDAAADIRGSADDRAIEDAVRYTMRGEASLAHAMFERFLDGCEMQAVERALNS